MTLAKRFIDEKLAIHWQVDKSRESFDKLIHHLEKRTNFLPYFQKALEQTPIGKTPGGIKVGEIGAGVGWTSAILGKRSDVSRVYAVEPSRNRRERISIVADHFSVPEGKVIPVDGTFQDFNIPEKVHLIVMCASLHHCYERDISILFRNIREYLLPAPEGGIVLFANEHYVNLLWSVKIFLSWLRHFPKRTDLYYGPGRWRVPHPYDGEHWRTRKELEEIFGREGFKVQWYLHDGDLCKDKPNWYYRLGWTYYHLILKLVF